jgi:hypothetical protein
MGNINWLASYPKSGNTWVRIFLANLMVDNDTPVDINELQEFSIASNRDAFDELSGLSSSDLTLDEIERLRPHVYEVQSESTTEKLFLKIHDAYVYTCEGIPLVSTKATNKALYIIRNPLDVAVSFAHHLGATNEKAVENMCNEQFAFCNKTIKLHKQLEQKLLSWEKHVLSWTQQQNIPVKVVRYEDLLNLPESTFTSIVDFFELDYSKSQVLSAIQNSSFSELKKQEDTHGFIEKSPQAKSFFRKGKAGLGKEELGEELANKIITCNESLMQQFGYL